MDTYIGTVGKRQGTLSRGWMQKLWGFRGVKNGCSATALYNARRNQSDAVMVVRIQKKPLNAVHIPNLDPQLNIYCLQ
jgi:hypothetical protein